MRSSRFGPGDFECRKKARIASRIEAENSTKNVP
jgi:hypothetical protein